VLYKKRFGRKLDLEDPKTLNEKILKLKLESYEKDTLVKQCSDKYAVRDYVQNCGCGDILIPLIASYDRPDDIEWNKLPEDFAMKWNYGSGFNIICRDKSKLDINKTVKQLKKWRKDPYYLVHSEMQYKGVNKKIIVEKLLKNESGNTPEDYKFYCFNGRVELIMVCLNRRKENGSILADYIFYDRDWEIKPYSSDSYSAIEKKFCYPRPDNIDKAIEYAEKLSAPFKFVRTDLYLCGEDIYFGELTFTPAGGLDTDLLIGDAEMGKLLDI
jgi:hypothetical protein